MKRRMIGNINNEKSIRKDNYQFIFISLFIFLLWLIPQLLLLEIFDKKIFYNPYNLNLKLPFYFSCLIIIIIYVFYVINSIFKKDYLYTKNNQIYLFLYLIYSLIIHIIILVVSNNALIVFTSLFFLHLLFFIIPFIKFFKKRSYNDFVNNVNKTYKNDYLLTAIFALVMFVSIIDIIFFKRKNLINLVYDINLLLSNITFLIIIVFIIPKYSSILWVNIYYRKYALEKDNVLDFDVKDFRESSIDISCVNYSTNSIEVIFNDDVKVIFDPIWMEMCFYDINNEKVSMGYSKVNKTEKSSINKLDYNIFVNNEVRKVSLWVMESSNLVTKITTYNQTFESNYDPSIFEKIIDKFSIVLLLFAFFDFSSLWTLFFIFYIIYLRIIYLKFSIRLTIEILMLIISIIFYFLIFF